MIVLMFVLIFLIFGFVFAKLDTIFKISKILKDDVAKLQQDIANIKNKQ